MQKFLLITTLDNSKEWPFAQYHETAALQSLYRHAIKVNIKKVFKLETPMIVRHCVSMFNESTGGRRGSLFFSIRLAHSFSFRSTPFPLISCTRHLRACPRQISRIRPSVLICVATTFPNEKIFKLEREECLARSVVISPRQQKVNSRLIRVFRRWVYATRLIIALINQFLYFSIYYIDVDL